MKKIALLFTIVCVGQLYGMEPKKELTKKEALEIYKSLLPELKLGVLNQALAVSNDLDEAIDMINKLSIVYKEQYNNLQDFTNLVHILADKFNTTTEKIAEKFGTEIAKKYVSLGKNLTKAIFWHETKEEVKQYIKQGADVNYSDEQHSTPLIAAVRSNRIDILTLLLNAKANPFYKHSTEGTALNFTVRMMEEFHKEGTPSLAENMEPLKKLLEDIMKRQSQ